MSFDWNDQNIQRAFVYGCFESRKSAKTAVNLMKKHVTVDTLTVNEWFQEFRATKNSSTRRGRLVGQKVPEQGTQVVNNADSISNSDFLADREIKREIEEDSETSQPDVKRSRLGPTTDMGDSSALTHEIGAEVDRSIKVEVYEDCNISEIDIYLGVDSVTIKKTLMDDSCLPPQEFPHKTGDPTQYSFIHRAISEVRTIFNAPNLKLDKLSIRHDNYENGLTKEKRRTFDKELLQMMEGLSEKLHLRDFEIFVESPEVLFRFLKTIHPEFIRKLKIRNHPENFDIRRMGLLEHWYNLEYYSSDFVLFTLNT